MALTIKDIAAASYASVVAERNKPANQWSESAAMRALQRKGFIKKQPLGRTIQAPLDYVANAGGTFLATDITATSLSKTSVIGAAEYSISSVSVPVVWTKQDEATNPETNQKIAYVTSLLENALETHDDLIEVALFAAAATQGFESLRTSVTEAGTGTIGGIDSAVDTMWKNQFKDYDAAAALLADMTTVFTACAKGSGGSEPTLILTAPTPYGVYEGKLTANQRFTNSSDANGGFESLKFHGAEVVFSHRYTDESFFFLNPKAIKLVVSSSHFRDKGEVNEVDDANAYVMKIYSALQLVTLNRSRLGVAFT